MKSIAFVFSLCHAAAATEGNIARQHNVLRTTSSHPHKGGTVAAQPRFVDAADQRKAPFTHDLAETPPVSAPAPVKKTMTETTNATCHGGSFMAIYWGVVAVIFALWLGLAYYKEIYGDSKNPSVPIDLFRQSSKSEALDDVLAANVWSMNLVAAIGQAKYPSGRTMHPMSVLLVSLLMSVLQVFALFLVLDSVNPAARPITTVPTTPWKTAQHAWTVNSMKWVMVTFLGMSVVSEAGDAHKVFANAFMIDGSRLQTWRLIPLMTSVLHYVINIGVVIVGVSVVLCCQDVPSILYNSLAITFINRFDDTTHEFLQKVCGCESDFHIQHQAWKEPPWLEVFERFVVLLPFLWAFFLIGRAWCTNQMPSVLLAWVLAAVNNEG